MTVDAIVTWIIAGMAASGPVASRRRGGRLRRHRGARDHGAFRRRLAFEALRVSIGAGLVNNIITVFVGCAVLMVVGRVLPRP